MNSKVGMVRIVWSVIVRFEALVLVILLLVIPLLGSCATESVKAASDNGDPRLTPEMQELLELDFTEQLATSTFATFDNPEAVGEPIDQMRLDWLRESTSIDIQENMTENEQKRLGIWELPSGEAITLFNLHFLLIRFYKHNGRLPFTGAELFPELAALTEGEVNDLDPDAVFAEYAMGINPMTGYFYDSFESTAWTPGGYSITVFDDPDEIAARWPHQRIYSDPQNTDSELVVPKSVWKVRIFGETFNSIIYDNLIWVD